MGKTHNLQRGFTVIEMLIVVIIIALLIGVVALGYGAVQRNARDTSVLSDLDALDGLETRCSLNPGPTGCNVGTNYAKAWYSGSGVDSYLGFTPSSGNVIDVVVNTTDYCIRGYNPSGNKNSLANAAIKESSDGACATLGASAAAIAGDTSTSSGYATLTWTQQTSSGSRNWKALASSADGTKLVGVVNNGFIYTSTDSGVTWTQRATSQSWTSVASSSDGVKLVAVTYGFIYTSTDSGVTWTQRATGQYWESVVSSSDGTKLAAGTNQIYTSTDSGVTWAVTSSPWAGSGYLALASSADGTKLVAGNNGGSIYTSTNSGSTWVPRAGPGTQSWGALASSADGNKLALYPQGAAIYTSTNSGSTWTQSSTGSGYCNGIVSSSDGSKLIAGNNGTYIYASIDSGVTWTQKTLPVSGCWEAFASSSDGKNLVIAPYGGYIYTGVYTD